MTRPEILDAAKKCVCGDREQDYGAVENNFQTIADLWVVYLRSRGLALDYLEAHDVAAMLALLKIARIASGNAKADNWIDLAGYAACGGEVQGEAVNPVTVEPRKRMPADYVTPIAYEPVEPWGDEDEVRQNELFCNVGRCRSGCVFKEKANADKLESCVYWTKAHPAEARKIMDEMEAAE